VQRRGKTEDTLKMVLAILEANFATELGGRRGGCFCLLSPVSHNPIQYFMVGEVPKDKEEKYRLFAREKADRLLLNREHKSSWQSRNEEAGQYGGAIRGCEYLFSFSGLPQLLDEALMLVVAIIHGDLDYEGARAIIHESQNPHFVKLYNLAIVNQP